MRRSAIGTVVSVLLLSGALYATPGSAETAGSSEAPLQAAAGGAGTAVKRTPGNLGGPSDLFVQGELLVQFKKGVKRGLSRQVHTGRGGARVLDRITGFGGRIEHVRLAPGLSVAQAVRRYGKDPNVAVAEPNFRYRWMGHISPPVDDPQAGQLWGLQNTAQSHGISDPPPPNASGTVGADIDVVSAWVTEDGDNTDPIVAVVDSGVLITHDDLDENLWVNPLEFSGAPFVDDDGNGYVDDKHGCSFAPPSCDNLSDEAPGGGHGTHVAGTIAAEGENTEGVIGVCPHCRIMVLKFDLTTAGEVAAYAYARRNGAQVVNGSFGGPVWSKMSYNAIKKLNQAGIVAVFAAGNDSLDNDTAAGNPGTGGISPAFPASYNLPNIIAVAASNHHDEYGYFTGCHSPSQGFPKKACSFSNVGRESVDVAAPGVDILSTIKTGDQQYDEYNGTSMAAPHVAGVAGLVRSEFPGLSPVQVKNKIMHGTDKNLPTMNTVFSGVLKGGRAKGKFSRTNGRLNAAGALAAGTGNATPKTDGDVPGAKKINRVKKNRVAYPNDVNDVYKKRLRKGKRYRATLRVPKKKDFDLWIWRPKIKQIWQFDSACFSGGKRCPVVAASFKGKGKNEVITFKATKKGFYYFHVTAWLKSKGRYKLVIKPI